MYAAAGAFPTSPSRLCAWCSFQKLCPEFGGTAPPLDPDAVERATGVRPAPGVQDGNLTVAKVISDVTATKPRKFGHTNPVEACQARYGRQRRQLHVSAHTHGDRTRGVCAAQSCGRVLDGDALARIHALTAGPP